MVETSSLSIRSIELQLVRIEELKVAGTKQIKKASEIQTIQVADGNVCRSFVIPICMVFPRLYSRPSMSISEVNLDFSVNLVIVFVDGCMISESFPININRGNKV